MGGLAVQEVQYAEQLRYLLIVLQGQGEQTRQAFLALQPNNQQLGDAHTGEQLVGVIVTMAGRLHSRGCIGPSACAAPPACCKYGAALLALRCKASPPNLLPVLGPAGDGAPHHFLSRFFAPWAGIAEDPVTGSAHSVLGPYWAAQLGRQQLAARQCSARGGELKVEVRAGEGRVVVSGSAVVVMQGRLLI